MGDYTERELERAARLKAVDESLRGETLYAIADLLRVIPPAAYAEYEAVMEHRRRDDSLGRSR